jgi:thiol-disulfide isomerase/thioredoxin
MIRTLTAFAAVVLVAAAAEAADETKAKPSEVAEKFETLKKDYAAATDAYEKLVRAGKAAEAKAALERNNPHDYLNKLVQLAFFHPSDPASFDVLHFLAVHGESDLYLWDQVMGLLRRDHVASPKMKHIVRLLVKRDDDTASLLRDLIAKSPDRKVGAQACRLLLDYTGTEVKTAEEITDKPFLKPLLERRVGEEYLKRVLTDLEKNKKEVADLTDLLADKYKGALPDLATGMLLPESLVDDLAGKKVKLADLRGKVVVLMLLATTDATATKIADHQRELAKKYADRPLVVVNIFVDEKKEAVADFLKKNPTPWTTAWGGAKDNLLEDWGLPATPATFVLDGRGVIRSRNRGTLDEVLPGLVKEAEKK